MTTKEKKQHVLALFSLNKDFFFDRIDADEAEGLEDDPATIESTDTYGQHREFFTLKDEFRSKLETMSLSEMVQLSSVSKIEELSKKINTIKSWVVFLGWYTIIMIVAWIVFYFWADAQLSELESMWNF